MVGLAIRSDGQNDSGSRADSGTDVDTESKGSILWLFVGNGDGLSGMKTA